MDCTTNTPSQMENVFIKQEPDVCEDNPDISVKEEQEELTDDMYGFDAHAWALNHLKVETKAFEEDQYSTCRYGDDIVRPNYNNNIISEGRNINIDQVASSSNSDPKRNHMWINLDKVYFCEICHKTFSTKGNLGNHMRSHTQEKPFRCNTCGRCFSFNCNLKTHYLTHTGIKPFQCSMCGKCFSTKGNMSVHLRIHTGERPYKCTICFRSFTVKDNLQRHMKIHIPLQSFNV